MPITLRTFQSFAWITCGNLYTGIQTSGIQNDFTSECFRNQILFQLSYTTNLNFAIYLEQSTPKGRPFTCSGHAPIVKLGAGWLVGDMVNGNASDGEVDVVVILNPFGDLLGVRGDSSTNCSRFCEILRLCRNSPSLEKSPFPFECNWFNCCCWWKVANKEEVSCRC